MTLTETDLQGIRTELVSGIAQSNRRRTRRRMVAAVPALALVAMAGVVIADSGDNPAHALERQTDGTIRVEIYPDFDDVDALRDDLGGAGLDVAVIQLRAHQSLEGVVEIASHENTASGALEFQGSEFVIDPEAVTGEIEVLIYSPTNTGDTYQAAPSVFAPGQELAGLHCALSDRPLTTQGLEDRATDAGVSGFVWTTFGEIDEVSGLVDFTESEVRPDGFVTGARMRDELTMDVFVSSDDDTPAAASIVMTDGTHYRETPECSPELAAAWE